MGKGAHHADIFAIAQLSWFKIQAMQQAVQCENESVQLHCSASTWRHHSIITQKPNAHGRTSPKFCAWCPWPWLDRSSFIGVVMGYVNVLPVLWITALMW